MDLLRVPMRSFFVLVLLGVILATIAIVVRSGMLARKNPGRPINAAMRAAMDTPQFSTEDAAIIDQKYPSPHKLSSGVLYVVRAPGHGKTPRQGSLVRVAYTASLLNGTVFDSSAANGGPLNYTAGTSVFPPGVTETILTMREGEKRTAIIPYWLGFGERAVGKVPARSTVVFDIELIEVQ